MFVSKSLEGFDLNNQHTHGLETHPQDPSPDTFFKINPDTGVQNTANHPPLNNSMATRFAATFVSVSDSSKKVAQSLLEHVTVECEKKPSKVLSVLTRARSLSSDPLVLKIYEKCDYLRQLFGRTSQFKDQQELRDEFSDNFKNITGVLGVPEELKIIAMAVSFYPDTPWLKSLARHYAKITNTTEPDATMQFTAYFTYPCAARPETTKNLDAFMASLRKLAQPH